MKIFFDSSFFFPFIRIDIQNVSKKYIGTLLSNRNFEFYCSELVYFELSAKASKFILQGILKIEDLLDGISFIHNYQKIKKIPIFHPEILILSQEFRNNHKDYIDCLILASAIKSADKFITLDTELKRKINTLWNGIIVKENPFFTVNLWSEINQK